MESNLRPVVQLLVWSTWAWLRAENQMLSINEGFFKKLPSFTEINEKGQMRASLKNILCLQNPHSFIASDRHKEDIVNGGIFRCLAWLLNRLGLERSGTTCLRPSVPFPRTTVHLPLLTKELKPRLSQTCPTCCLVMLIWRPCVCDVIIKVCLSIFH